MNVLIIKLGALGDICLSSSIIKKIQEHHENVHLLTCPPHQEFFEIWSGLSVTSLSRKGFISALKMLSWIRNKHFDRVYDLQSNDRTRCILSLSGIPERIGNHPIFPYTASPPTKYLGKEHIFVRLNEVLTSIGIEEAKPLPYIPATEHDEEKVLLWMNKNKLINKKFILLHAGASPKHPEKCWPYYLQLAQKLREKDIISIWLGSDHEKEINRSYAATNGIDATNAFSLRQLPIIGRYALCSITNDSGPMHILAAAEKPVFAFFGPTNWRRCHALGQVKYVITQQPKDIMGKRLTDPKYDLKNIKYDLVLRKLKETGLV